ncbi:MAG: EamA family transporter [Pseudomonadota bacterium]
MESKVKTMKISDVCLAILVALIWGFNFVVIKVGLGSFPPLLFSALRFTFSAIPAVLFINRGNVSWRWIISIGVSLGIVMFGLLFIGMNIGMPAGLSSVVLQVQAIFTLMLSSIILRDYPSLWQKIGMAVSFGGIGLLIYEMFGSTSLLGLVLVICAGSVWAFSNILMKLSGNIDMFRLIIWMSIVPPVPLFFLSLLFEEGHLQAMSDITWIGIGTVFYSALVSTVLAFGIWGKLFKEYSPNIVAPFSLLVPIFGIISSVIVLNETFSAIQVAATLLVFTGLSLVVFGTRISTFIMLKLNI